ncbi:DotU family type IV/VI secretion system protein [Chitinimonas koreensis]|uniref:DotU family type IV/VI secretion system protein n=1 Tax=Chitinimonas koreensis TaxID=356302 RepID=UPI0003F8AF98|nr:DotU family type IV/VI secretion system protein [Chitinimonas koreensis]QNM95339.1 DotU family type IV/VI secretion system protein [Chitinimonas koreensis]
MHDADWSHGVLIGRFAEFYEEVALCKQAIVDGRLALMFAGDLPAEPSPHDLAALVSGRLAQRLAAQGRDVAEHAGDAEQRAYRVAQFAMAALADEIFILEVRWPAAEHWLSHLLEYTLFRRREAGRMFFELLASLLRTRGRGQLQLELAAVFLLALQLGFKGEYRGRSGQAALAEYRKRLLGFIAARRPADLLAGPAFPQAYAYTLGDAADRRLAPLTPWYRAAAIGLVVYLLLSSALWFKALVPITSLLHTLMGNGG